MSKKTKLQPLWQVTFIGDYFVMMTNGTLAKDEDEAIDKSAELIMENYGWDIKAVSTDIDTAQLTDLF